MKPVPLHVVKHFNGDETRTLSKHLNREPALQVAQRFATNLLEKQRQLQEGTLQLLTHSEDDVTVHRVQNISTGDVSNEGVVVLVQTQTDPHWDYPRHSDLRTSDSGHVATDSAHLKWPFTLLPR